METNKQTNKQIKSANNSNYNGKNWFNFVEDLHVRRIHTYTRSHRLNCGKHAVANTFWIGGTFRWLAPNHSVSFALRTCLLLLIVHVFIHNTIQISNEVCHKKHHTRHRVFISFATVTCKKGFELLFSTNCCFLLHSIHVLHIIFISISGNRSHISNVVCVCTLTF